jgi:type II secretory ATPase GspE/PulE/Tfp pilus assembly ATPase PilB-like protein
MKDFSEEQINQKTDVKINIISENDLINLLISKKVVTIDQIEVAIKEKKDTRINKSIGNILVEMGLITDLVLSDILNNNKSDNFDIKSTFLDQRLIRKIPKVFAIQNKVIPVLFEKNTVTVATFDLYDIITLDQVKKFFPPSMNIETVYATESDIMKAIDQYYEYEMSIDGILDEIENIDINKFNEEQNISNNYQSPLVRLVNAILMDAVRKGASDLHFEPELFFLRLRYRIHGEMEQIRVFHNKYWSAIVVRIKIMSGMNIAETRRAQDGRINSTILGRNIDFRISSQPTINGENIVMRILDEKKSILSLTKLGFNEENIKTIKKCTKKPEGVILLTGPTGSGKTTTLYTLLNMINKIGINIMTLENPVEYRLPIIRQSSINPEIGVDFADGIRTLLRQDPDVILVGEIRDEKTATAAIQAAMTGHQVYSSLHTNDAFSAIPRLLQIGVQPFLLSGALIAIVAQRLARKICPFCKTKYPITDEEKRIITKVLGEEEAGVVTHFYKGIGCDKCRGSGYTSRTVIAEILDVDKEIDDMIVREARKKEILEYLLKRGYVTMQVDGIRKVIQGITTLTELSRVVNIADYLE